MGRDGRGRVFRRGCEGGGVFWGWGLSGEDMVKGVSVVGEGVGEFCRVVSEGRFWGLLMAGNRIWTNLLVSNSTYLVVTISGMLTNPRVSI